MNNLMSSDDKIAKLKNTLDTRDTNGLICANDLHKVYGGEEKDRPKFFLETSQSKAIIDVVSSGGNLPVQILVKKEGGNGGGTWMCPELAIEYCRWLDPVFGMQANQIIYGIATDKVIIQPTQQVNNFVIPSTEVEIATLELEREQTPLDRMLQSVGVSDGYRKAIFLENLLRKEIEKNVIIIPHACKPMLKDSDAIEYDKTKGKHAAIMTTGAEGTKVTDIAKRIGVKTEVINKVFVALGWCYKTSTAPYYYVITESGKAYGFPSNTKSGKHGDVKRVDMWYADAVIPHIKKYLGIK